MALFSRKKVRLFHSILAPLPQQIISSSTFSTPPFREGIWISSRLALGTLLQVGVCVTTPFVALYAIRYAVDFVVDNEGANEDGSVSVSPKL